VTEPRCITRSGQLAMGALGRLREDERTELDRHLRTCGKCRAMSAELRSTVDALGFWHEGRMPGPRTAVPGRRGGAAEAEPGVDSGRTERRRKIRTTAIAGASMAAAVVAAVSVAGAMHSPQAPSRTVALHGAPGVTAEAALVDESWGTALTIREQGLMPGQTITVSMANSTGRWWTAGSYRTTSAASVEARMACAAAFASIDQIRVTDSSGRSILTSRPKAAY
jgi:hypothetical protein